MVAPGSVVVVRDEEWLVTSIENTLDGPLLHVQGLSDLVRGTTASYYESLDDIEALDPRLATVCADSSPGYRRARLWLEATLRKAAVPLVDDRLVVSDGMLADPLPYQHSAVRKALDPDNLRPRVLLADAVGLGKTLEIGMILSELVRRGRGERILIVCPRHVLEQMQHEMWSRFAMPFVRLDSVGIQRVKQKLPATRNPFTYFKRVIISIDTLKQDHLVTHLRRHRWDAVVIDESHNVTNSATQNNRLARVLSPNTDALILASATPHNGKPESFAELVRLLEPTAVTPTGELIPDEVKRLVVRRHRNSDEVKQVVGADWADRMEPQNLLIDATRDEDAVAEELETVWLHPQSGSSPYAGANSQLFPWTLAKAFLSSPSALEATIRERIKRAPATASGKIEKLALERLNALNQKTFPSSAKYDALVSYLRQIGVGKGATKRAVIFAERVPTLEWLRAKLQKEFSFTPSEVQLLHGGLTDVEQQGIVESFKQAGSPIRILVTGDVASEGVNLHRQCHQLIHYDIPWSLIRIEQRNGRIDRYGQLRRPQITTLLLSPSSDTFGGDLRVLSKLIEKEQEAHKALGDAASLMGKYSVEAEEEAIRKVLAREAAFEDVVADAHDPGSLDQLAALMALIQTGPAPSETSIDNGPNLPKTALYLHEIDFLREALEEIYVTPAESTSRNGVNWREYPDQQYAEFEPPADLRQRLEVLPQSYLSERKVLEKLKLATSPAKGKQLLEAALKDQSQSSWPEAHFLGPLHPVLDWAADRALSRLARNQVFAVRGDVDEPTVLLHGSLTDRRGNVVAAAWFSAEFPGLEKSGRPGRAFIQIHADATEMLSAVGFGATATNPGPVSLAGTESLITAAADSASAVLAGQFSAATQATRARISQWSARIESWQQRADDLGGRLFLKERRIGVQREQQLTDEMAPDRQLVRPLLLVLPKDHPSDFSEGR
jgi:ERCC4-related helicase